MNQLGKNLVLSLCVFATLLVILGLKRKLDGGSEAVLLSQSSEDVEMTTPATARNAPRPRVLQSKPVAQHDGEILSPTSPRQYADSEVESSRTNGFSIAPIPTANSNPLASARPVDASELVPIGVSAASPVPPSVDDEGPHAEAALETPTADVATRPLPDFVLTDSEDSFWSISEKVYGTGVYYRALFRHNEAKVLRPDQLRAGIEVRTPPLEVLREKYPDDFPRDPSFAPSP